MTSTTTHDPPHPPHHHHSTLHTSHTPSSTSAPAPSTPIIPPLSFSMVVPNIYRSGYPLPINHPFLTLLRLRSIIYLSDTAPLSHTLHWAATQSPPITIHHIPLLAVKEPFIENDPMGMKEALEILLDTRNYPVLVHSNKGKHRVGVFVACLRKLLMGWGVAATFAEYARYSGEKGEADLEFIELFNPELTFDARYAPEWLRAQPTEKQVDNAPGDQASEEGQVQKQRVGHICRVGYHPITEEPKISL